MTSRRKGASAPDAESSPRASRRRAPARRRAGKAPATTAITTAASTANSTANSTTNSAAATGRTQLAAPAALARVAKQLSNPSPREGARRARRSPGSSSSERGVLDLALPARPVPLELIGGRAHYERVIAAILGAHTSVWIATANVKGLLVEDGRAAPGRRRAHRRSAYVSILAHLDELARRGVELRLLHAELPSRPFREELAKHPRLVAGGLQLARCPRVHLKLVIVDGALLYLGSANWTGAGLGAKGTGRRNFELGIVTDDGPLLDQVQALYDHLWSGGECATCKLRDECPGPLAELAARR